MKYKRYPIKTENDLCYLHITNTELFAIIDSKNLEKVLQHNKYFHLSGRNYDYVVCWSKALKRKIALHTIIIGKLFVDHKDRNKLNNKEENLREASDAQNLVNRIKYKLGNRSASSKYKGVTWDGNKQKWQAQISYKYRNHFLGRFDKEEEAALAYNNKARELYGEFAAINIIMELAKI